MAWRVLDEHNSIALTINKDLDRWPAIFNGDTITG
jgi:hypothetical protein